MNEWFEIDNANQVLSPALLFYPQRIKNNIQQMIKIAGTADRLRPHVKTYKCKEVVRLQMEAGIVKFKCATLSEAQMLAEAGVLDILVAYPLVGANQVGFKKLTDRFPQAKFSALIDHAEQLRQWETNNLLPVNLFIDLNVGMNRTGIAPENAYELFKAIKNKDIFFQGFHVYDGHIHDQLITERQASVSRSFKLVETLIHGMLPNTIQPFEVICGGSISFPIHAAHIGRQLSPGTTLLWDQGYTANFPDLPFEIAATVLTRVISKPGENELCLDLGHKAIASEMEEPPVYFPQIPDAIIRVLSEEHMVIETQDASNWLIGTEIYGYPWHICPTVALHEQAGIVKNKIMNEHWTIAARNRIYQL